MRIPLFSAFLLLIVLAAGCSTDADSVAPEQVQTHLFGQLWLNSYEARPDETPTYRPQGYTWAEPPVRYGAPFEGGDGFRFAKDGTLTYIAPSIGPGPTRHEGIWWQNDDKSVFYVHLNDNYRPDFQVQVVSISPDLLRARYLPQ